MFANMHVKTRLYAGFMVVLALLALVAAASVWVFGSVSGQFQTFGQSSAQALQAVQIDRQILAFNAEVGDYVRSPSEDAAVGVQRHAKALSDNLQALRVQMAEEAAYQHVDAIVEAFARYSQQLAPAMDLVAQRTILITQSLTPLAESVVTEVQAVRETSNSLTDAKVAGQLIQHMLQAQRAVDDYLLTHSEESFSLAWEYLFKADEEILQLKGAGSAKDLYQSYQDALNALSGTIGDILNAQEALDREGKIISDEAANVRDLALKKQAMIQAKSAEQLAGARTLVLSLTFVSLLMGAGAAFLIGRSLVNPILDMTDAMRALAAGDKSVRIPATHRRDEIGQMAAAVQVFKDNALEVEHLEHERVAADAKAADERRNAMLSLADSLESSVAGTVKAISASASEMQSSAQAMSATAEDTTRQASSVASATLQANTNVEVVASAAEELAASIREIGEQVTLSAQVASNAVKEARRATGQVEGLLEATSHIGEVVQLITAIAEQTNLLALNATIEAARAGDAGKGFAVVANEVKNLANQTGRATQDIGEQITAVQSATHDAVQAIQTIAGVIDRINEIAAAISAAVEEQGAATQEIARNTQQAALGTHSVSDTIGEVQVAAKETGDAASIVLERANGLSGQADELMRAVNSFLQHVRQS